MCGHPNTARSQLPAECGCCSVLAEHRPLSTTYRIVWGLEHLHWVWKNGKPQQGAKKSIPRKRITHETLNPARVNGAEGQEEVGALLSQVSEALSDRIKDLLYKTNLHVTAALYTIRKQCWEQQEKGSAPPHLVTSLTSRAQASASSSPFLLSNPS